MLALESSAAAAGAAAGVGSGAGAGGPRAPAAEMKLCSFLCLFGISALGTSIDHLCRIYAESRTTADEPPRPSPASPRHAPYGTPVLTSQRRRPIFCAAPCARPGASLAPRRAVDCDASSRPNFTAVTRSARSNFACPHRRSGSLPARTSSGVAFRGHRMSHQRDVYTIWRAVCTSLAASIAGRRTLSMPPQSASY